MEYSGLLSSFPRGIKLFIGAFVMVLSVGYYTGLLFVSQTSSTTPNGIVVNYLGNENEEGAEMMKFKKSDREMLTIIHTHILSMSFIFFLMGGLLWLTKLPLKWKLFLTIEPFFSVIVTFGGIYLLWSGLLWMRYIVVFSGILMTMVFTMALFVLLHQLALSPVHKA